MTIEAKQTIAQIWLLASVFTLMVTFQGCDGLSVGNDFLEKPPSEGVNQDTVFSKAEFAKEFLWHAYESLPYGALSVAGPYDTNLMNDDPQASITDINHSYKSNGGSNYYYTGSYTSGIENQDQKPFATKYNFYNSGAWDGIRGARIFLENVDRVPDMDEAAKQRLKAEARMIIAVHYTELFRHYGGMIWVDHAPGPNEDFQLPRLTARATLDSLVTLIDRAATDLPFALDQASTEAGRFTKAGAMGLKCRVLLFGASPLFNSSGPYMEGEAASQELVWYGGKDPSLWQDAADACGSLIDRVEQTGDYHLSDTGNPRQDFQHAYYDRTSPELLISTRKRYKAGGMPNYYTSGNAKGAVCTTHNYVQMFPMADGTPIDAPGSGYDPNNPYDNRDPRLYKTVLTNGDEYQNRMAELWIGGRERPSDNFRGTRSGYRLRKFILDVNDAVGNPVQWPYLRLAEIYLSYAEVLNEVNGGPTPEAYEYVNKVRNRVGLNDLPTGLSQQEFRDAVIRERVLELGYENVRWFDIIRWKLEEVFDKTLYGMNITRNSDNSFNYNRVELPRRVWQDNFSPKWYLSAFPRNEINKQYGLVQNPGW